MVVVGFTARTTHRMVCRMRAETPKPRCAPPPMCSTRAETSSPPYASPLIRRYYLLRVCPPHAPHHTTPCTTQRHGTSGSGRGGRRRRCSRQGLSGSSKVSDSLHPKDAHGEMPCIQYLSCVSSWYARTRQTFLSLKFFWLPVFERTMMRARHDRRHRQRCRCYLMSC